MSLNEIEVLARNLSPAERASLARRWLAEEHPESNGVPQAQDDLIASVGAVISRRRDSPGPIEEDPIWGLGTSPVDLGVTDASVNHDHYAYGYRRQGE